MTNTVNRLPIWTNDPEWQDQDTGVTLPEGKTHLKRNGQLTLMEENMAKFSKAKTETKTEKAAPKGKAASKGKAVKTKASPKGNPKKEGGFGGGSLDEKKIKVLMKAHGAREGSKRAAKWDALVSSKTIGEARAKEDTIDAGSVSAAVKAGVISID